MSIYSAFEKVAAKQLSKFGVEVTFTQVSDTSFDPALGDTVESSVTFTGYGIKSNFTKSEINGSTVLREDVKLMLEKTDLEPLVGDTAAVNGDGSYRVIDVMPTAPAEEAVIYTVQLRR